MKDVSVGKLIALALFMMVSGNTLACVDKAVDDMANVENCKKQALAGDAEHGSCVGERLPPRAQFAAVTRAVVLDERVLVSPGLPAVLRHLPRDACGGVVSATTLGTEVKPEWALRTFEFCYTGGWLNLVLLALNLLPIPPLDGSRILATVSNPYRRLLNHPNAGMFGLAFFVIVFWITPIGRVAYGFIENAALLWVGIVQGIIMAASGN